jgi:hypothetical protein
MLEQEINCGNFSKIKKERKKNSALAAREDNSDTDLISICPSYVSLVTNSSSAVW